MRIPARLLIITLLAVALYLPAAIGQKPAIGQQPGTVNVRPRVTTSLVRVDRNRVPLGDLVTFTLTAAGVVMNSRSKVTLYFGDDKHQVMPPEGKIVYLYRKPGTYTYSILVEPSGSPTPTPTPALPGVNLTATPGSVEIDCPVDFAAQLSRPYPNIKYRFVFADGSQTAWRDSPQTTHSYRSPGTYQAYVDIGLGNSGAVKQVDGSPRRAIEVTPPLRTIAVDLTANKVTIQAKDEVEFFARVNSNERNISYRFDFGDRSRLTAWQVSPRITHTYSVRGTYPARVDVRVINSRCGSQTASSSPLPIEVTAIEPKPSVNLTAVPQSVLAGLPVFFRATTASANSNTRYRFNFGDGSSGDWKEKPEDTHIYSLAGNYAAFVEIGSARSGPIDATAASDRKPVRVVRITPPPPETPTPTPPSPSPLPSASPSPTGFESPTPNASPSVPETPSPTGTPTPNPTPDSGGSSSDWWKYLLAALILFGAYQGWKAFYAPRPTLVPNLDPGNSDLGSESGPLGINFQMELNRNVTDGQVAVNTDGGSLIKSERKSDD